MSKNQDYQLTLQNNSKTFGKGKFTWWLLNIYSKILKENDSQKQFVIQIIVYIMFLVGSEFFIDPNEYTNTIDWIYSEMTCQN